MRGGYLARRLASAFFTIVLIALINFLLFRAMPGSPERAILRGTPNVTPEILQAARERWGLDKPVFPDQSPGLWERLLGFLAHLRLPLGTVALGLVGQYAIVMRSSIIETLSEDYVTTARAMGLSDGRILRRHALPNALLPTVSLVAINLG